MIKKILLLIAIIVTNQACKSQKIDNQFYQIVSLKYQKSINIPKASERNGEEMIVWSKTDCKFNQEWRFEKVHKYYIIRSKYNNKVLTVKSNFVVQWDFKDEDNQYWTVKKTKGGFFLLSKENGLALSVEKDVSSKRELILLEFDKRESQKWNIEPSNVKFFKADFTKVLSPEEMKEDLKYFFSKLEEVHVNPYAFVSKDSLEMRKEMLLKELDKPLMRYKFNRKISALNSMFDGHTGIADVDWDYFNHYKNSYGRFIPFHFNYTPEHITIDSPEDSLKNVVIKSINNISIEEITTEIEKRENSEIRQMRNNIIGNRFHVYLYCLFDIQAPYNIEVYDTVENTYKQLEYKGLPNFRMPIKKKVKRKKYDFRIYPNESIAIIEHNTCRYNYGSSEEKEFFNYIDSVFQIVKMQGVQHLFIDISRNGGGSSTVNYVFYRNINHIPNPWKGEYTRRVSQESKFLLTELSLYHDSSPYEERMAKYQAKINSGDLSDYVTRFVNTKNGELMGGNYIKNTDSVTNGYSKNIYLIQSYNSYSAAMDIAAWFKYGKVGTVIGTETGGTTEVYIEGIPLFFPNSKIQFSIADQYDKLPDGQLNRGIQPDIDLGNNFYKEIYELNDLKHYIQIVKDKL